MKSTLWPDIVCYVLNLFALVNAPRVIFRTAFIHYLLISIIVCLDLQHFLRFITGSCLLPQGPCRIDVLFSDDDEGCIFASTCLLQLHVPRHFESYEGFKAAMKAVSDPSGQAFNSICGDWPWPIKVYLSENERNSFGPT